MKYPVKPGHRERLVSWIERLEDRAPELVAAMAEGGFIAEAVFLEKSDRGDYILIYTSAQDLQAGVEALSNSKLPLVREFNQVLAESVDTGNAVSLKLVYHTP